MRWFGGALLAASAAAAAAPSWLRGATVATPYDLQPPGWTWEAGVERAVADGATVILDWGRLSDDWRCLADPCLAADLADLARRAAWVHRHPGVRYLVYISPLEYVTPGVDRDGDGRVDPDAAGEALSVRHPDWPQTGISGRPAVFFGAMPGMPFWVCPDCEDVWVTPANPELVALVLEQARRAARSGIDGLWLDVPFLRGDFGEDWTGEFPDVGRDARARFAAETGRTLPPPPLTADWSDPAWLAYIAWRHRLVRDLVGSVAAAIHGERPGFALVVESSVAFGPELTQYAASPLDIPAVADATVHEVGGVERGGSRGAWLWYLARLAAWRHIDLRHRDPSLLLGYVEAGHSDTAAVARLHAAGAVAAGFGLHVSGNETMSGVPDPALRRALFAWIGANRARLYPAGLRPLARIAVLFSQRNLDFRARGSWERADVADGFYGTLMALLDAGIPFEVIGEADLARLARYRALILPGIEALSDGEAEAIRAWVAAGGQLLATGLTSACDALGRPRAQFALADLFGVGLERVREWDPEVYERRYGAGRVVFAPAPREREVFWAWAPWDPDGGDPEAAAAAVRAVTGLVGRLGVASPLAVAPREGIVTLPFLGPDGSVRVGIVNLRGVGPGHPVPDPVTVRLAVTGEASARVRAARWLELLGEPLTPSLERRGNTVSVTFAVATGGVLELSAGPPPRRARGRVPPARGNSPGHPAS